MKRELEARLAIGAKLVDLHANSLVGGGYSSETISADHDSSGNSELFKYHIECCQRRRGENPPALMVGCRSALTRMSKIARDWL